MTCEAKKVDGRWVCYAEKCPHRIEGGGCQLNKATVTCDNNDCRWNVELAPGVYGAELWIYIWMLTGNAFLINL